LSFGAGLGGTATIVVRAMDSGTLFVEDTFVLTVTSVNDAPTVVSAIADTTVGESNPPFTYRDLNDVFDDLEDDGALAFTIESNSNPGLVTATTGTSMTGEVTFRSVSTASEGVNATAVDVGKPAGTVQGDLLIASFTADGKPTLSPPDASWTLIEGGAGNPVDNTPSFGVWYKIAGASEPSVYTFTSDADTQLYIAVVRYDGQDPVSPINASAIANSTGSSTPTAPDVTTTVDGCRILRLFGADDDDTPYAVPGGHSERYNGVSNTGTSTCGSAGADTDQTVAGATGIAAFSMNDVEEWQAVTIAITPATAGNLDLSFAPAASGEATIVVRATDPGALFAEDAFVVMVTPVNDAPTVASAIPDTTVAQDSAPIDGYRDLNDVFLDMEDGSALAFAIESNSNPSLVTPTIDPTDSTLDLSFAPGQSGEATVVVRATDSGALTVDDTLVVTVTPVNDAPIVASAIPDTTVAQDSAPIDGYRDLNDVFTDTEDGSALAFAIESNSNPSLVTPTIDPTDSTLDLSFTPGQSGTATVVIRATDSGGLWVNDTIELAVTPENNAPVVIAAIPDTTVMENSPLIDGYRDLNDVFSDIEDGSALAFVVHSNSDPLLVSATIDADSALDLGFAAGFSGEATVVIRATDSGALSVDDTLVVTVGPGNNTPTVVTSIPDTLVAVDSAPVTDYRDLNDVFADTEDGSALAFTIEDNTNPSLVSVTIDADSALDLSPTPGQSGSAVITVRGTDSGALWVEDVFEITVGANAEPIVVSAIPDTTINDDAPVIGYRDLNDVFKDVEDGDALTFSVEANTSPDLVTATVDPADSTLYLSMGTEQSGTAVLVIRATDSGGLWVEDVFIISVTAVNDAPIVAEAIPDTLVFENGPPLNDYRVLTDVFTDEEDGTNLTYVIHDNSNPALVAATIDPGDALDLSFAADQGGVATIVIRATDSGGLSVDDTLAVTVSTATAVDDPILPDGFALGQNVPNPFNPTTTISFDIGQPGRVDLRIYDVSGRLIRTLVSGELPSTRHTVEWDGRDDSGALASSGVYFYRLTTRDFDATKKMLLLK
jgi:hypothetical protein